MENGDNPDETRLWALLSDLMEQTNKHRAFSAQLHSQANDIKVCGQTPGFRLLITYYARHKRFILRLASYYDGASESASQDVQ